MPSMTLTEAARVGYDGADNPHPRSSPLWAAHAVGRHLRDSGRCVPCGVRTGRDHSIWANDMQFAYTVAEGRIAFERVA